MCRRQHRTLLNPQSLSCRGKKTPTFSFNQKVSKKFQKVLKKFQKSFNQKVFPAAAKRHRLSVSTKTPTKNFSDMGLAGVGWYIWPLFINILMMGFVSSSLHICICIWYISWWSIIYVLYILDPQATFFVENFANIYRKWNIFFLIDNEIKRHCHWFMSIYDDCWLMLMLMIWL